MRPLAQITSQQLLLPFKAVVNAISLNCPVKGYWDENPPVAEIAAITAGSFKRRSPPEIKGTDYVVQSLEAALWRAGSSEVREKIFTEARAGVYNVDSPELIWRTSPRQKSRPHEKT
jgi:hypothetical protein